MPNSVGNPFHVIRLVYQRLDEVRCRGQNPRR